MALGGDAVKERAEIGVIFGKLDEETLSGRGMGERRKKHTEREADRVHL